MDSSQTETIIEDAAASSSFYITSENPIGTLSQQQSQNVAESVVNLHNLADDYLTRKKNKKRDKSPQIAILLPSTIMNSPSAFNTNELTLSNNAISNGPLQLAAPLNSNSANFTNLSSTASTTTPLAVQPAVTTIQIITKKEKQRPETWNKIEQQIFFNALRQNGKNFESITQYFNARQKRFKGDVDVQQNVQRSKEQIRHFYYRTWHKIIKLITIKLTKEEQQTVSPDPNSTPQTSLTSTKSPISSTTSTTIVLDDQCSLRDTQVKCLIAFNALMNKSQRWNKKTAIKLVELINHGWTTVREKGKITRLRMPICKLSSKVTTKEEAEPNNTLPHLICVQLEPKTETAYCRVHRLAQNPFISIKLKSLQSVRYLIEFLEEKWKSRRDQFIEKFKIDSETNSSSSKNKATSNKQATNVAPTTVQTSSISTVNSVAEQTNANESTNDDENFQNIKKNLLNEMNLNANNTNNQNNNQSGQHTSTAISSNDIFEKLILFPNETHQLSNIDLIEATNMSSMNLMDDQLIETNYFISNNNATNTVEIVNNQEPEEQEQPMSNLKRMSQDDEPMLVDECANVTTSGKQTNSSSKKNAQQKQPRVLFQLNVEQLKSGLTAFSSNISSTSNKETKDLTMLQLYLAFNKPQIIKLKYDWVLVNKSNSGQFTYNSFAQNHNRQQRFYLDSLASVANSFLNDLQKAKSESVASTSTGSKASNALNKSPPKAISQSQANNTAKSVVSNCANVAKVNINSNSSSGQRIAFLQPSNSPSKATILPIEAVLQQINEEQTNKTKKLLSDLNSKRRTRNRKPIMVVNSAHNPPRTMLPKLLNGQPLFIKSSNEYLSFHINNNSPNTVSLNTVDIQNSPQVDGMPTQTIVYSAPVAAIARQIVNNSSTSSITSQSIVQQQQQSPQTKTVQFQNTFSNILPHIINSLQNDSVQIVGEDNESENNNNNANNQQITSNFETNQGDNLATEHLGDMSLLDLSINNNDSLFATANNIITCTNETSNQIPTQINLFGSISIGSNGKVDRSEQSFLHLKTNNIEETNVESEVPTSSTVLNNAISNSSQNSICFDLNQKRAELMNEWSDSMNDISLSACFISDLQSPEKPSSKNIIHVLNENSRDSIFFNMDTIMDIMPPQPTARFDESSLITNLNANNLQNS